MRMEKNQSVDKGHNKRLGGPSYGPRVASSMPLTYGKKKNTLNRIHLILNTELLNVCFVSIKNGTTFYLQQCNCLFF